MEVYFRNWEYGKDYEIASVRYTKYDGYGDRTEVIVSNDKDDYKYKPKMEKYVFKGHLSIDRIVDKLLQNNVIENDFETEEDDCCVE